MGSLTGMALLVADHLPFGAHTAIDILRLVVIVGAGGAILFYARAAVLFRNHTKGGMPAAYVPTNLAIIVALVITITDQALRIGNPTTWRVYAFVLLVTFAHWSFDRLGLTPWRRQKWAVPQSEATSRIMRQVEALGEAVFVMDRKGVCMDVNNVAVGLFGYGRSELVGRNLHSVLHYKCIDGTLIPHADCPLQQAMARATAITNAQIVLWDKNDLPVTCSFNSTPVIEGTTVTGAVAVFAEQVRAS